MKSTFYISWMFFGIFHFISSGGRVSPKIALHVGCEMQYQKTLHLDVHFQCSFQQQLRASRRWLITFNVWLAVWSDSLERTAIIVGCQGRMSQHTKVFSNEWRVSSPCPFLYDGRKEAVTPGLSSPSHRWLDESVCAMRLSRLKCCTAVSVTS